jgi:squalene cyclase
MLAHAIDAGLDFLRANQDDAGCWCDWQLPPGQSRMWTTAYIGYRLSSLPGGRVGAIVDSLTRAEAWLRAAELPGGGWGYSPETGPDADTTSLALLFLRARGVPIGEDSRQRVRSHQQADGGFSTYTGGSSWGSWIQSHPDVTAVALQALSVTATSASSAELGQGMRYVREHARADGLWESFWWTSCLYATEAMLAFLREAVEPLDGARLMASLRTVPTPAPFESALWLLCLLHLGGAAGGLASDRAAALVSDQRPDGSWASHPVLRLTSRHVREPWNAEDSAPLFADDRRLFTTATVVAALAAYEGASSTASG